MSIMGTIKGWFSMLLQGRAKEEFQIKPIESAAVDSFLSLCGRIYSGHPDWLDPDDHIRTVNFASILCSEAAKLATLDIGIHSTGSTRAEWIQTEIDKLRQDLRGWMEYACAYGTVILKPNGDGVDLYTRNSFEVTHHTNGEIDGVVFLDQTEQGGKWYTRLEYHRFEDGAYAITNKCSISDSPTGKGKPIKIEKTPWRELAEDVRLLNVDRPLFGVLHMPHANHIDHTSPYSLPLFSHAIEELRDLDIAYSRNAKEIVDSKRTVLLDSDRMLPTGGRVNTTAGYFNARRESLGLPDFIKAVEGTGMEPFYREINPALNTTERLEGINAILGQIGFKSGFSNGYLVFNEKTGMITATQVESDDRRTIQLIADLREGLKSCVDGLVYALDKFADLYDLAPVGVYEITYDFGDITYNHEEDRARWYGYATAGKVPFWLYLVKFEGYTEEEAKAISQEAEPPTISLFGGS